MEVLTRQAGPVRDDRPHRLRADLEGVRLDDALVRGLAITARPAVPEEEVHVIGAVGSADACDDRLAHPPDHPEVLRQLDGRSGARPGARPGRRPATRPAARPTARVATRLGRRLTRAIDGQAARAG